MSDAVRLGRDAEDRAAEYLRSLGYIILTKRFRAKGGEIDIIALEGDTLVFVEVKFRRSLLDSPEAAVTAGKRHRIETAARAYFAAMDQPALYSRFDLVAMDPFELRHFSDAFSSEQAQSAPPAPEDDAFI